MILTQHIAIYVPTIRVIDEPRLIGQADRGRPRVALGLLCADQLRIVAIVVVGADMMKNEDSVHFADMRRYANVCKWAKTVVDQFRDSTSCKLGWSHLKNGRDRRKAPVSIDIALLA